MQYAIAMSAFKAQLHTGQKLFTVLTCLTRLARVKLLYNHALTRYDSPYANIVREIRVVGLPRSIETAAFQA